MINLLPPEIRDSISYARRNTGLVKWGVGLMAGLSGVIIVALAGYLYINQQTRAYASDVQAKKNDLSSQKLEDTQKRVEEISSSTKLALQVLSKQVLFSKLLRQIGSAMPEGASLQNLSIGKLEGGITLQAGAVDYQTATQVQINLQDKNNKIFEKADILSINCASEEDDSGYPCQISIRALFAKDSTFIFTNNTAGSTR